jgi:hypothetical protein
VHDGLARQKEDGRLKALPLSPKLAVRQPRFLELKRIVSNVLQSPAHFDEVTRLHAPAEVKLYPQRGRIPRRSALVEICHRRNCTAAGAPEACH